MIFKKNILLPQNYEFDHWKIVEKNSQKIYQIRTRKYHIWEGIIQQLENQIKKLNKVQKCSYGNNIDLKEEISHLNKVVMDKEEKLAQLHEKLENQETEFCHRQ